MARAAKEEKVCFAALFFCLILAPSPLTRFPVVFPFPSEQAITQTEEDDAPATNGGGASRRSWMNDEDNKGGAAAGTAATRQARTLMSKMGGEDVVTRMTMVGRRQGGGRQAGPRQWGEFGC